LVTTINCAPKVQDSIPSDDGMKGEQIGFIAQDVQHLLPDTILTANDKDKTLSIKYNELIPVLTNSLLKNPSI